MMAVLDDGIFVFLLLESRNSFWTLMMHVHIQRFPFELAELFLVFAGSGWDSKHFVFYSKGPCVDSQNGFSDAKIVSGGSMEPAIQPASPPASQLASRSRAGSGWL